MTAKGTGRGLQVCISVRCATRIVELDFVQIQRVPQLILHETVLPSSQHAAGSRPYLKVNPDLCRSTFHPEQAKMYHFNSR